MLKPVEMAKIAALALDEKLGLSRAPVSARELYETALIVREQASARVGALAKLTSGSTVMPA